MPGHGHVVIAVDGRSGSGKSTLAEALVADLGAALVSGDDFYRVMEEDARRSLTAVEGVSLYFDWERLRDEAILPLRAGLPARYNPYGWVEGGGLSPRRVVIEPRSIVVVEGVYSARRELADLVDVAVLVETAPAERLERLSLRGHGNEDWHSRWEAAEDLYFASLRPASSFDLVIPGCERSTRPDSGVTPLPADSYSRVRWH